MRDRHYNNDPTPPTPTPFEVLYEDNHLLVTVKPAGLLVQGDATGDETLFARAKAYVKEKYNKPGQVYLGLVHRLDRPTYGVVVFARTSKAAARLSQQFRERGVRKSYVALVDGVVKADSGAAAHYLKRNRQRRQTDLCEESTPGSRLAELQYRVLSRGRRTTLVEVNPSSGRKHQIRVQLAAMGHPVVGDTKYGAGSIPLGKNIALAALRIEIEHPTTGQRLAFEAPPPRWYADGAK